MLGSDQYSITSMSTGNVSISVRTLRNPHRSSAELVGLILRVSRCVLRRPVVGVRAVRRRERLSVKLVSRLSRGVYDVIAAVGDAKAQELFAKHGIELMSDKEIGSGHSPIAGLSSRPAC